MKWINDLQNACEPLSAISTSQLHRRLDGKENRRLNAARFRKIFNVLLAKYNEGGFTEGSLFEKVRVLYAIYGLLILHHDQFADSHAASQTSLSAIRSRFFYYTDADKYEALLRQSIQEISKVLKALADINAIVFHEKIFNELTVDKYLASAASFENTLCAFGFICEVYPDALASTKKTSATEGAAIGTFNIMGFLLGGGAGLALTSAISYYYAKNSLIVYKPKMAAPKTESDLQECNIVPTLRSVLLDEGPLNRLLSHYPNSDADAPNFNMMQQLSDSPQSIAFEMGGFNFDRAIKDFNELLESHPGIAVAGMVSVLSCFSENLLIKSPSLSPLHKAQIINLASVLKTTVTAANVSIPNRSKRNLILHTMLVEAVLLNTSQTQIVKYFADILEIKACRFPLDAGLVGDMTILKNESTKRSSIYLGQFDNSDKCVLKKFHAGGQHDSRFLTLKSFLTELNTMSQLAVSADHPVIGLHGILYVEQNLYILMDYASRGDVHNVSIHENDEYNQRLGSFTYQIASALAFLHGNSWVHGDIKPSNFFVRADYSLVLGDFEFATDGQFSTYQQPYSYGTMGFISPEMYFPMSDKKRFTRRTGLTESDCKIGVATDMWGFGVSISAMYSSEMRKGVRRGLQIDSSKLHSNFEAAINRRTVENGAFAIADDNALNQAELEPVKAVVLKAFRLNQRDRITAQDAAEQLKPYSTVKQKTMEM